MGLRQSWTQQLLRASGAALIVPAALVSALVVLALAGGFARLGSFSQVFSGPTLAASAGPGGRGTDVTGAAQLSHALAAVPAAAVSPTATALTVVSAGPSPAPHTTTSTRPPTDGGSQIGTGIGTGRPTGGGTPHSGGGTSTTAGGSPTGSGGTGAAGGGSGVSGVVSGVTSVATAVTGKVPGPLGTAATSTLKTVSSTLTGLLGGR